MIYDTIIVGSGVAGMTAGIYLKRAGKNVLILEKSTIGGQIASSPLVENYPGYKNISGAELVNNMYEQVDALGINIELEEVTKIIPGKIKKVITDSNEYETKSIIIASGSHYRLLGLDREEDFIGNGIHFCVACDGSFYKDKIVTVVGGGNSGVINATMLSDIASKVYLIQNLSSLTAEKSLVDRLLSKDNVKVIYNAKVTKYIGDDHLEKIVILENDKEKELTTDGVFLSIGLVPETAFVKDILTLNKFNYIESNGSITDIDGIFVGGDCRDKKVRQLTVATSDGTIAALDAIEYLNNQD